MHYLHFCKSSKVTHSLSSNMSNFTDFGKFHALLLLIPEVYFQHDKYTANTSMNASFCLLLSSLLKSSSYARVHHIRTSMHFIEEDSLVQGLLGRKLMFLSSHPRYLSHEMYASRCLLVKHVVLWGLVTCILVGGA